MPDRYRRLSFEVEPGGAEPLAAALWESGTLGIEETADGRIVAYFSDADPEARIDWRGSGARLVASDACAASDWMAAYRAQARPLEVGSRLVVDPGEPPPFSERPEPNADRERRLLRLPARTAFGTGSHPSTSLVVELLEELDLEGTSVLDVGAGSGILSFAAQIFGARWVVGVEVDLEAALVAAQNRSLNGLFPGFVAGGVGALRTGRAFDLAVVNVLPERIAADLEAIRLLLRPGGSAIFSGILVDAADAVRGRLRAAGFGDSSERSRDEWCALLTEVAA